MFPLDALLVLALCEACCIMRMSSGKEQAQPVHAGGEVLAWTCSIKAEPQQGTNGTQWWTVLKSGC